MVCIYVCMYLFAIIKQQKFKINKIQYTKIKQFNQQISDKNPSIEKSLDHRWQGRALTRKLQLGDYYWVTTVSYPICVSQFHYGEVRTHASCETAKTWDSFDH